MAGHRLPTTGERGFDIPYVTVAPCGFATITGGSRGTLSYVNCTVDCTARCSTNLFLKAPFTTGMAERKKVAYGTFCSAACLHILTNKSVLLLVRLGSSWLKVSQIILGCMSYGSPEWRNWVLPEGESIKTHQGNVSIIRIQLIAMIRFWRWFPWQVMMQESIRLIQPTRVKSALFFYLISWPWIAWLGVF